MKKIYIAVFAALLCACSSQAQKEDNGLKPSVAREPAVNKHEAKIAVSPVSSVNQTQTVKKELSKTARSLASQGFVNVSDVDSSIVVSLMYSRPDNFCGVVLYDDLVEAYLHPKAAKAIRKAQQYLKSIRPDLSLIIYDAARPMHIQQKMWNQVKNTNKSIYVSNPARGGGMHNYGMAVDISLCTLNGDSLDMGTTVDYMGKAAHIDNEAALVANKKMSVEARKNRQLLRKVMKYAGWMPLRTEWWHFNLCSRKTAKAYYKVIK